MRTLTVLFLCLYLLDCVSALTCVSCANATCIPPLPSCELGRRLCSCCMECRLKLGDACSSFTTECESELVCLTTAGAFIGRPPFILNYLVGQCVEPRATTHARSSYVIKQQITKN